MARVALLIGVSEYEYGLNPLPGAIKDVEAIQQILLNPEMGEFADADIVLLKNPVRQKMEEAIEHLFSGRRKDDLVLLYFSGHGIKDDVGKLYLGTHQTRKNQNGELFRASAVAASFVQDSMSRSRSKRQVVILDCCFSGAFAEGLSIKDDGSIDIKTQLGGEGRVVLASSSSIDYSFIPNNLDLSIYTQYLVEGIQTGAADQDGDGVIAVDELHEYAKRKVQEAAPAMKPEIHAVKEGFKIRIARAPVGDPKLLYRREVEQFIDRGVISNTIQAALNYRRQKLGLSFEEAEQIENEVLKPFRTHQQNLQQYEKEFLEAVWQQYPFNEGTRNDLRYLQQTLGLSDEDIQPIEAKIIRRRITPSSQVGNSSTQHSIATPNNGSSPQTASEPLPLMLSVSPPVVEPVESTNQPASRRQTLLMQVGIVTILVALSGGSFYAFTKWQTDRTEQLTFQKAKTLQSQGKYQECLTEAGNISTTSRFYTEIQMLLSDCQREKQAQELLNQATQLETSQSFQEAIAKASQIPANSLFYSDAQTLITRCSQKLLDHASGRYDAGDLEGAKSIANAIPANNSMHQKAQATIAQWQQEWDNNTAHLQKIEEVLQVNDFEGALQEANLITRGSSFWKQKADTAIADINQRKQEDDRRLAEEAERERQRQLAEQAERERLEQLEIQRQAEQANCERFKDEYDSNLDVRRQVGLVGGEIRAKCRDEYEVVIPQG